MVVVRSALLLWERGDPAAAAVVCEEGPSPGEAEHDRDVANFHGQGVEGEFGYTKCDIDCIGRWHTIGKGWPSIP